MKKFLVGCGVLILLAVLAAVIGVMSLPKNYLVERELQMQATPEAAYEVVSNLSTWPEWTVWNKDMDPEATWEFSGAQSGDGAHWSWNGEELGDGQLTLRDCTAPTSITYNLVMNDGTFSSVGTLTISEDSGGILVHWQNSGELSGPMILLSPFVDSMTGPMYELGLQNLKARLESSK